MKVRHKPRIPVISPPKKPTLLMNIGVGWSATTPFLYTLSIDQRYCHPGHIKENHYLRMIFEQDCCNKFDIHKFILSTSANEKEWIFRKWQKELFEYSYHFLDDPDYIKEWYSLPVTIDKYIDYYLKHWEVIKSDFHAVADFSNHNWAIPYYENGADMIKEIQKEFELKITVQFRDPIRRLYSELGTCFIDKRVPHVFTVGTRSKLLKGRKYLQNNQHNDFYKFCLDDGAWDSANCRYIDLLTKWESLVGTANILPIIMEEFWDPTYRKQQCERLSNFLDAPIQKIHKNVYFPDKGADAPHYTGLIDQWTSDKETITEESIEYAMNYFKPCYNEWKEKFGELPELWSKP